jgi:hypothetical protein
MLEPIATPMACLAVSTVNTDGGAMERPYQIHLIPDGNDDSGYVLGGVSNYGYQDQPNEILADMCTLNERVDTPHEVLGTDGNGKGSHNQHNGGRDGPHDGFFRLAVASPRTLRLGIEEVLVRLELEPEIEDVEEQENHGRPS